MPVLTNSKHELFAQEIAKGVSGREAYRTAGYTAKSDAGADVSASRLLKDAKVAARIAELQEGAAEKAMISKQWVIERLIENANRAMQAVEVKDSEGNGTGEYKYDGSVANKALELLGKEVGMFVDRKQTTNVSYIIADKPMSPDEWESKYCMETPGGSSTSSH